MVKYTISFSILLILAVAYLGHVQGLPGPQDSLDWVGKKDVTGWKTWLRQKFHQSMELPGKIFDKAEDKVEKMYKNAHDKFALYEESLGLNFVMLLEGFAKGIESGNPIQILNNLQKPILSLFKNSIAHSQEALDHVKKESEKYIAAARKTESEYTEHISTKISEFLKRFVHDHVKTFGEKGGECLASTKKEVQSKIDTLTEVTSHCIDGFIKFNIANYEDFKQTTQRAILNIRRDKKTFLECYNKLSSQDITNFKIENVKNITIIGHCAKSTSGKIMDSILELFYMPFGVKNLGRKFAKLPEYVAGCLPHDDKFQSSTEKLLESCVLTPNKDDETAVGYDESWTDDDIVHIKPYKNP